MSTKEPLRASNGQGLEKKAGTAKVKGMSIFNEYKDGNGYTIKVANMQNPLVCKRTGVVEIECLKKTNSMEPRFTISNVFDEELGIWFGVPLGIDARTKEIRWQRFAVGDRKSYDLTKNADAVEWAVVSRAPWLIGSPYQKGKPHYKMFDKDAEAQEIITKSTIRSKAMEIVTNEIAIKDMMDIYRVFGRNPEGFSPLRLKAELIKIAEKSPKEFYDTWSSSNRSLLIIFNRCVSLGIINFDVAKGGYLWKDGLALGITEQSAMEYLTKNPQLLQQANLESQAKDGYQKKFQSMSDPEKSFFGVGEEESIDDELMDLRMQAALLKVPGFKDMDKETLQRAVDELSEG